MYVGLGGSEIGIRDRGWVYAGDDGLVYRREPPDHSALVHLARLAHEPVRLPAAALPGIAGGAAAYGPDPRFEGEDLVLGADGPHVGVWTWHPGE